MVVRPERWNAQWGGEDMLRTTPQRKEYKNTKQAVYKIPLTPPLKKGEADPLLL
jgi:hypothetical protein